MPDLNLSSDDLQFIAWDLTRAYVARLDDIIHQLREEVESERLDAATGERLVAQFQVQADRAQKLSDQLTEIDIAAYEAGEDDLSTTSDPEN